MATKILVKLSQTCPDEGTSDLVKRGALEAVTDFECEVDINDPISKFLDNLEKRFPHSSKYAMPNGWRVCYGKHVCKAGDEVVEDRTPPGKRIVVSESEPSDRELGRINLNDTIVHYSNLPADPVESGARSMQRAVSGT